MWWVYPALVACTISDEHHKAQAAAARRQQYDDRDVIDVEARVIEDVPALPAPPLALRRNP